MYQKRVFEHFEVICKKCGSKNVEMDIYAEGFDYPYYVDLQCKDCGNLWRFEEGEE
jgi:RNase P subunit RPR2